MKDIPTTKHNYAGISYTKLIHATKNVIQPMKRTNQIKIFTKKNKDRKTISANKTENYNDKKYKDLEKLAQPYIPAELILN